MVYPLELSSDFSRLVKDRLVIIAKQLRKYFVPERRKSAESFARFLGDPLLFWDEPIQVEAAIKEFVDARKKYELPEDVSFVCLSVDEIKGRGKTHYYGRYSFTDGDADFVDFGTLGPEARRTGIFSKWAQLRSLDNLPIDAISIRFAPNPNW